jgi:hypothetical protein
MIAEGKAGSCRSQHSSWQRYRYCYRGDLYSDEDDHQQTPRKRDTLDAMMTRCDSTAVRGRHTVMR